MKLEGLTKSELAELAQLAQAESAKRKARADLTAWCRLAGYIPASHQALLVRALERIGLPAVPGTADPPPGLGRISDQPSLIPGGPPTSAPISPAVKLREVGNITSLPKFLPARPKVEHVRAPQVN